MSTEPESDPKIIVDEDWKSRVEREREQLQQQKSTADPQTQKQQPPPRLPPASFSNLVNSLAAQAIAALGDAAAPPDAKKDEQRLDPQLALELARHLIDTLSVLDEKTRGNLTPDEHAMLEQGLHELRMAFVEVRNRLTASG